MGSIASLLAALPPPLSSTIAATRLPPPATTTRNTFPHSTISLLMFHLLPLVLPKYLAMGVQPQHSDDGLTRCGIDRLRQRRGHVVVLLGAVQTCGYYSNDDVVLVLRMMED